MSVHETVSPAAYLRIDVQALPRTGKRYVMLIHHMHLGSD